MRAPWIPQYPTKVHSPNSGEREIQVPVDEAKQTECPVSIISRHPKMDVYVSEIFHMQRVKDATGAVPYGPDSSLWDARWHDAVRLFEIETNKVIAAQDKARDDARG